MNSLLSNFAVISHNNHLLFVFAFLGGIFSSLSPCALGVAPLVLSYVFGKDQLTFFRKFLNIFLFMLGLSITLSVIGAISSAAGKSIGVYSSPVLALIAASVIMIMGLNQLEIIELPTISTAKVPDFIFKVSFLAPIFLGVFYAFCSTPCATPVLVSLAAIASVKSNIFVGMILFFLYSFGQGVVLLLLAMLVLGTERLKFFRTHSALFHKASGILLIIAAVYLYWLVFS